MGVIATSADHIPAQSFDAGTHSPLVTMPHQNDYQHLQKKELIRSIPASIHIFEASPHAEHAA
jgi:hypothetical protein